MTEVGRGSEECSNKDRGGLRAEAIGDRGGRGKWAGRRGSVIMAAKQLRKSARPGRCRWGT